MSTFAATFAALYAAHMIGDYWVQTHRQATRKGLPGWPGRLACAAHVTTYTLTALIVLTATAWRLHMPLPAGQLTAALVVSAITHYVADRRAPLRRLCIATGKNREWLDQGGLALMDQSWHVGWLFVAAMILAA